MWHFLHSQLPFHEYNPSFVLAVLQTHSLEITSKRSIRITSSLKALERKGVIVYFVAENEGRSSSLEDISTCKAFVYSRKREKPKSVDGATNPTRRIVGINSLYIAKVKSAKDLSQTEMKKRRTLTSIFNLERKIHSDTSAQQFSHFTVEIPCDIVHLQSIFYSPPVFTRFEVTLGDCGEEFPEKKPPIRYSGSLSSAASESSTITEMDIEAAEVLLELSTKSRINCFQNSGLVDVQYPKIRPKWWHNTIGDIRLGEMVESTIKFLVNI